VDSFLSQFLALLRRRPAAISARDGVGPDRWRSYI
jgi:hypothetical protein